jgi:hypothetical protein
MTRKRANTAAAAFGRVGLAPVGDSPAESDDSADADIPASGNAGAIAGNPVSLVADEPASGKASTRASRKAGKRKRRVGRPRGPERVALTVRILAATDARLTEAVETLGESPQYIVDAALAQYLDGLGISRQAKG